MTHELKSERLLLAPAQRSDIGALMEMVSNTESLKQRRAGVTALVSTSLTSFPEHGFGVWVLRQPPALAPVGFCALRPHDRPNEPELLYGLLSSARGNGFATEAARAILHEAFEHCSVLTIWAIAEARNVAAIRVLERLGMSFADKREQNGIENLIYRVAAPPRAPRKSRKARK